jgi:hypothetical protein
MVRDHQKQQHLHIKLVFLSAVERYDLVFLTTSLDGNLIATNSTTSNSSEHMMVLISKDNSQLSNNCMHWARFLTRLLMLPNGII